MKGYDPSLEDCPQRQTLISLKNHCFLGEIQIRKNLFQFSSWHCTNCATCTVSLTRAAAAVGLNSKFARVFRGGEKRAKAGQFFPATPIKQVLARTTPVYISLANTHWKDWSRNRNASIHYCFLIVEVSQVILS